ncbi:hypothetical protein CWC22_010920 [Pseudoalteromonas rubra]|uniref:Uncharacterized protein n=1 Tax=Pseudoalteromonas rubra TaxID=43658 RepID=A0A5S3UPF9_9GAMM|nr:hypothetical protein [Pseudoalteromonas rubra]QPB83470.1 hypothetical protein CWC22_010920 [Pseudoalteromonas rubra]
MKGKINWIDPWWHLKQCAIKDAIQRELACEVGPEHPLWQCELSVIAKSEANDDVIVQLGDGRFACIHLTWSGKIDSQPDQFPSSMIFDNIESLQIYMNEVAAQYA